MTADFLDFAANELLEHGEILRASDVEEVRRLGVRINLPFLNADERSELFPLELSELTFHPIWFDSNGRQYGPAFITAKLQVWPGETYVIFLKTSLELLLSKFAQERVFKLDSTKSIASSTGELHE